MGVVTWGTWFLLVSTLWVICEASPQTQQLAVGTHRPGSTAKHLYRLGSDLTELPVNSKAFKSHRACDSIFYVT